MEQYNYEETNPRQLAQEHVEWLIEFIVPIIRRIGIEEFVHGYKHGFKEGQRHVSASLDCQHADKGGT